jgi:hypothetical protein
MAFKVNYGQQRSERKRAKDARKSEKLKRREDAVTQRRQQREGDQPETPGGDGDGDDLAKS